MFVCIGLWTVVLISVSVESPTQPADKIIRKCYLVRNRNECFFFPLGWKISWNWARTFCTEHNGKLVNI